MTETRCKPTSLTGDVTSNRLRCITCRQRWVAGDMPPVCEGDAFPFIAAMPSATDSRIFVGAAPATMAVTFGHNDPNISATGEMQIGDPSSKPSAADLATATAVPPTLRLADGTRVAPEDRAEALEAAYQRRETEARNGAPYPGQVWMTPLGPQMWIGSSSGGADWHDRLNTVLHYDPRIGRERP